MSNPTFQDHFSGHTDDYRRFRPAYPEALYRYLADIAPATDLAWDVGCGNGQATRQLAAYFQSVTGSDASAEQIDQAHSADNIIYRVSPAETLSAQDNSLDLITVAQAIHWFNHPAFFMRARWRFSDLIGYINTWSAVKQFEACNNANPVEQHLEAFKSAWGPLDLTKDIYWPLILYVGRKRS